MYRFFFRLSRLMAIIGGLALCALIVLICLSIIGRTLNSIFYADIVQSLMPTLAEWVLSTGIGPIEGDFEIVEAGMAFTIFAFIPYCHITAGHASVDLFTNWLPERAQRVLRMVIEILFAIVLVIIAVQLEAGMQSKLRTGQTTLLLQFPVWWPYAFSLVGAVVAALVGVFTAFARIIEAFSEETIIDSRIGAGH
jgi:TRAP-type C4-dicarboxylate transport system permease small subunit